MIIYFDAMGQGQHRSYFFSVVYGFEKMEEMYLQMIELNKRVEVLETENSLLKEKRNFSALKKTELAVCLRNQKM